MTSEICAGVLRYYLKIVGNRDFNESCKPQENTRVVHGSCHVLHGIRCCRRVPCRTLKAAGVRLRHYLAWAIAGESLNGTLLNRGFVFCTMCSFFYTVFFFVFFTCISQYSQENFGISSAASGLVSSSLVAGDLVARVLFGRRMNIIGKKKLATVSGLCLVAVSVLCFVASSAEMLTAVRIIQGFCYGAMASCVATMVTEHLPESRRSEGIGYFMLSVTLGSAVGPWASMWVYSNISSDAMFGLGIAAAVSALICVLPINETKYDYTAEQIAEMKSLRLSNFIDRSALPLSLVCFILFFSYSGVLTFMSSYGAEIGLSDAAAYFFIFISISTCISRMFLGRIADRRGDNVAIIPFFLLFILGMVMISQAASGAVLLLGGFLLGFNIAQFVGVGQAAVVRGAPKDRFGVAICTFSIALDLSYAVGPIVHGAIIGGLGYRSDFLIMAGVATAAFFLYIVLHGIGEYRRLRQSSL